jgi:hypothetical protein
VLLVLLRRTERKRESNEEEESESERAEIDFFFSSIGNIIISDVYDSDEF